MHSNAHQIYSCVCVLGQSAMYGMMCQYVLKAISLRTKICICFNMYTSTASSTCTRKCGISIITTMYDNDGYLFRYKLCIPNQPHPYWNQSTNCTVFILWDTWHAFECIDAFSSELVRRKLSIVTYSSTLLFALFFEIYEYGRRTSDPG